MNAWTVVSAMRTRSSDVVRTVPAMVLLVAFAVLPFLAMMWYSLTNFSFTLPGHDGSFVGLDNYRRALTDSRFGASILVTAGFVTLAVFFEATIGLALAIVFASTRRSTRAGFALLSLPVVLPPVAVGLVWKLLLHGDYGLFGYPLLSRGWFGVTGSVLGTPSTAFTAAVITDVWQWTPFFALVLFAALKELPQAPREAALVDGATWSQVFRHITLPMLSPVMFAAVVIRALDALKEFDKIFALTRGGPASATEVLSLYIWIVSFDHGDLAYGAALTTLVYAVMLIAFMRAFRRFRRDWH